MELSFAAPGLAREFAADLAANLDVDALLERIPQIKNGTPLFFEGGHPARGWFNFGVLLNDAVADSTSRQYAYSAMRFANFIRDQGLELKQVTEADIIAYRMELTERAWAPITLTSFNTDAVVIRKIFAYFIHLGWLSHRPWFRMGAYDALSRPNTRQASARSISISNWLAFRDIGLGGMRPDGRLDSDFGGRFARRNVLGAQLALSTGMRLAEFSSLLVMEFGLDAPNRSSVSLTLKGAAKGNRERHVDIPASIYDRVRVYVQMERPAYASRLVSRRSTRHGLLIIEEFDAEKGRVLGNQGGKEFSYLLKELTFEQRRKAFLDRGRGLEPAALFLTERGRMPGKDAWQDVFRVASARVLSFASTASYLQGGVQPHSLRHTFAVIMLKFYSALPDFEGDPLIEVQRLLGHASPATTAKYVQYLRDFGAEIEEAMSGWNDEFASTAQLIESYNARQHELKHSVLGLEAQGAE